MVTIRDAVFDDLPDLLAIYNDAIVYLTATFDLVEKTLDERKAWFEQYGGKYPLIVAEMNGQVVGYSCLSPFREKEAYRLTSELSVYISRDHRGKGIGNALVKEILYRAKSNGFHAVIAGITGGNKTSVNLHEKYGFEFVGCLKEVGFKFGEWQDVHFYQLLIK